MKIEKLEESIIDKITSIRFCPNPGASVPTFTIIQGRNNIYSDIAQVIENCNDTLFIATTLEDISKMYLSIIPEKIKECQKIGGKVFLLVEIPDKRMISYVKRFKATETRICKIPSKGRIVVQKNKQLIMSDSSQESSNSETDFSISTNSKAKLSSWYRVFNSSRAFSRSFSSKTVSKVSSRQERISSVVIGCSVVKIRLSICCVRYSTGN